MVELLPESCLGRLTGAWPLNSEVLLVNVAALQQESIQLHLQGVNRVNVGGVSGLGHIVASC